MHFCSVLIVMISCGIDLIMTAMNYSRATQYISGLNYITILLWILMIYNALGLFVGYTSYKCFKNEFYARMGRDDPGFSMLPRNMSQYDNEN